jgi:PEP-CTERM motif
MNMLERKMKLALLGAAAGASMMALGVAPAAAIQIDGIDFVSGAQFDSTDVYENNVSNIGDHLQGVGVVNNIKSSGCGISNICWQNGQNGYQLTFSFDYIFEGFKVDPVTLLTTAVFSGGVINFYADNTTIANPQTGAGFTDGINWLNLVGGATGDTCASEGVATCFDSAALTLISHYAGGGQLHVNGAGSGNGFLEVDTTGAGAVNSYYDTNQIPTGHDLSLDTSFNGDIPTGIYGITGTASLKANIAAIPEPATLSLFGMGLAGLGFGAVRRRRNKA